MTIIVTGSSRGIGASILATLRDGGHAVIGQATATGNGADIAADFADPAAPRALWDAALARAGGTIDVLINNAGVFEANPLDRASDDWVADWERTQRINLTAAAELCRLAVLHWQDRKVGGRIVMPIGPSDTSTQLLRMTKRADGTLDRCTLGPALFVPFTGGRVPPFAPRALTDRSIPLCFRAPIVGVV